MTKHDELSQLARARLVRELKAFQTRKQAVTDFHNALCTELGSREGVFMVRPEHASHLAKSLREHTEQRRSDGLAMRLIMDPPAPEEDWAKRAVRATIVLGLGEDEHGRANMVLSATVEGRPGVSGLTLAFESQSTTSPDPSTLAKTLVQWMTDFLSKDSD